MRVLRGSCIFAFIGAFCFVDVLFAPFTGDKLFGCGDSFVRNTQAISTHVGNQTGCAHACDVNTFIKGLCRAHGTGSGKAKPAAGLLLQCRGNKRRCRYFFAGAVGQGADNKLFAFQVGQNFVRLLLVKHCTFFACCSAIKACRKLFRAALRRELCVDIPVFFGLECFDFFFAVYNQTYCDRLHTTGRKAAPDFTP